MDKIKFDTYTIFARMFSSILTLIPFFASWYFIKNSDKQLLGLGKFLQDLNFLGSITLSVVVLYLISLIIREISKYFENKYFIKAKGFPTTYLMLYEDPTYSEEFKNKYRSKVKELFDMNLLSKDEESVDPNEAKKRLNESIKQVILMLKDGYLVMSHNILYGFLRNFIGGCIMACLLCLGGIVVGFFIGKNLIIISTILFVIYSLIFIFRKSILVNNAEAYAKQLISEFMQKQINIKSPDKVTK